MQQGLHVAASISTMLVRYTGYPPFYSDDPLLTCRKIVNYKAFLKFPDEVELSPAARDLMSRLMCDVDDRLGTAGVQDIKVSTVRAAPRAVLTTAVAGGLEHDLPPLV